MLIEAIGESTIISGISLREDGNGKDGVGCVSREVIGSGWQIGTTSSGKALIIGEEDGVLIIWGEGIGVLIGVGWQEEIGVLIGCGWQSDVVDSVLTSACINISTTFSNSFLSVPLLVNEVPCNKKSCHEK